MFTSINRRIGKDQNQDKNNRAIFYDYVDKPTYTTNLLINDYNIVLFTTSCFILVFLNILEDYVTVTA